MMWPVRVRIFFTILGKFRNVGVFFRDWKVLEEIVIFGQFLEVLEFHFYHNGEQKI